MVLRYSIYGAAIRVAIAIVFLVCSVWLALFFQPHKGGGRIAWILSLNVESDGWLFLLLFGAFALFSLYFFAMSVWQFAIDDPAVILDNGVAEFHKSFPRSPRQIFLEDITNVMFARMDRLPRNSTETISAVVPGGWGAQLGMQCRYGLRIFYFDGERERQVTIYDNFVEGGAQALLRFGAGLRLTVRSRNN